MSNCLNALEREENLKSLNHEKFDQLIIVRHYWCRCSFRGRTAWDESSFNRNAGLCCWN